MSSSKTYLVPHDFTVVGEAATAHAVGIARRTGGRIILLHLVKSESDVAVAFSKLQGQIDALELAPSDPVVKAEVKVGSIFDGISNHAKELGASLVVMGTHGAKGLQKLFGSYAIKVITSSEVPFVIVQSKKPRRKIDTIVLPVDLTKESVQIIQFAADLAKIFDAEIHVVGRSESDNSLMAKIKNNLIYARKNLAKEGVKSTAALLEGAGSLEKRVLTYGNRVDTDMYAITYHTESLLPQFDSFAQSMITNEEELPVLIVNAKEVTSMYF